MIKEAIGTGNTVDEAKVAAMLELGISDFDEFTVEVLQTPTKKILGLFGGNPAKVKVSVTVPDPKPEKKQNKNNRPEKKQEKKDKFYLFGNNYEVIIDSNIESVKIEGNKLFVNSQNELDKYINSLIRDSQNSNLNLTIGMHNGKQVLQIGTATKNKAIQKYNDMTNAYYSAMETATSTVDNLKESFARMQDSTTKLGELISDISMGDLEIE